MQGKTVVYLLADRYPQLRLPIRTGMKDTSEYQNAVLRGIPFSGEPDFIGSEEDRFTVMETPAGKVEILYLAKREDFEHAFRALAYRCEPVDILPSVGASTMIGLINWEKINRHKEEYLSSGGMDWNEEFERFTAEKSNYRDTIILLSAGFYSNILAETVGLNEDEWKEKSLIIRKYHELTHFVCRRIYSNDIDSIRDEVFADCVGLVAAFGKYNPSLACEFLGIEKEGFRPGGRLSHYVEEEELPKSIDNAREIIDFCKTKVNGWNDQDVFSLIFALMDHESR